MTRKSGKREFQRNDRLHRVLAAGRRGAFEASSPPTEGVRAEALMVMVNCWLAGSLVPVVRRNEAILPTCRTASARADSSEGRGLGARERRLRPYAVLAVVRRTGTHSPTECRLEREARWSSSDVNSLWVSDMYLGRHPWWSQRVYGQNFMFLRRGPQSRQSTQIRSRLTSCNFLQLWILVRFFQIHFVFTPENIARKILVWIFEEKIS